MKQLTLLPVFIISVFFAAQAFPDSNSIPQIQSEPATLLSVSVTKEHWQLALNNKIFKGQIGSADSAEQADISTDTKVIAVDVVSKYNEGIEQVLKYAQATGKKPILALYIDGQRQGFELFKHAAKLCKEKDITLLLVNSFISVGDLIPLLATAKTTIAEQQPNIIHNQPETDLDKPQKTTDELEYWLNTKSGVRHNKGCRYYENTSQGRPCSANEGKPCKICGG